MDQVRRTSRTGPEGGLPSGPPTSLSEVTGISKLLGRIAPRAEALIVHLHTLPVSYSWATLFGEQINVLDLLVLTQSMDPTHYFSIFNILTSLEGRCVAYFSLALTCLSSGSRGKTSHLDHICFTRLRCSTHSNVVRRYRQSGRVDTYAQI